MEKDVISKNILFYQKQNHYTQLALAKKLGGSASLVSNYENGYSTPDIFTLWKMADIFDITIDELVGRK